MAQASLIIPHEEYDNQTVDNDIALIRTSKPMALHLPKSRAISLPSPGDDIRAGDDLTVSGWGYLEEDAMKFSHNLQVVTVKVLDRQSCNSIYEVKFDIFRISIFFKLKSFIKTHF